MTPLIEAQAVANYAEGMDALEKLVDSGVLVAIFILIVRWGPQIGSALLDRDDRMRKESAETVVTFVDEQKKDRHNVADQVERVILHVTKSQELIMDAIAKDHAEQMARLAEQSMERAGQLRDVEIHLLQSLGLLIGHKHRPAPRARLVKKKTSSTRA